MLLDRSRAKTWARLVYGGLAVIFMLSFVIGGVGSGQNFSISDILGTGGGSSTTAADSGDVGKLEKRTTDNPQSAEAWIRLGAAYNAANRPEDAISAYEKALALRKGNTELQQTLAGLYQGRAQTLQAESQSLQQQAASVQQQAPTSSPFAPTRTGPLGSAVEAPVDALQGKRAQDEATRLQAEAGQKQSEASTWFKKAFGPYQDLVTKSPTDANLWFRYGLAAYNAGDQKLAKRALGKFVELAPGDPQTPQIKQIIKQLDQPQVTTSGTGATATAGG